MNNLGIIVDDQILSIDCTLAGEPERVWPYLTRQEGLSTWLADGAIEPRLEGSVRLRFPMGAALVRSENGGLIYGQVDRCEPYRLLSFSWMDTSRDVQKPHFGASVTHVTFALTQCDQQTVLKLTHTGVSAKLLSKIGAGWHAHLRRLINRAQADASAYSAYPQLAASHEQRASMLQIDARHR